MFNIDQGNRYNILIIVVAIFAIALAASTITSVTEPSGTSDRINVDVVGSQDSQSDQNEQTKPDVEEGGALSSGGAVRLTYCIDFLTTPLAIGGMIAGIGLALFAVYRRYNLASSLFASFVIFPLTFGTWAILTNCISATGGSGQLMEGSSIVTNEGNGVVTAPPVSPTILAMVFGLLVVLSLAVMLTVTGRDETYEPVADDDIEEPDEADFARAAGKAADRIEEANVAVDNAVYRAWAEMTNLLDVPDPETSAPKDFEEAAIEFGLDEDDVSELTELFNEVRYGNRSAEKREERAIEILRHIEATYERSADEATDSVDGDTA